MDTPDTAPAVEPVKTGNWIRSERLHACQSLNCDVTVPRDEPLCAIGAGGHIKICAACAMRRFGYVVPADLPQQAIPKMSDAVEPTYTDGAMERFNRAHHAKTTREAIKTNLRLVRKANADDPKLKQLGKDA